MLKNNSKLASKLKQKFNFEKKYFFWCLFPLIWVAPISYFLIIWTTTNTTHSSNSPTTISETNDRLQYDQETTNFLKFLDLGENRNYSHSSLFNWKNQLTTQIEKAKELHAKYNTIQWRKSESSREDLGWLYLSQRRIDVFSDRLRDINRVLEYQEIIAHRDLTQQQKDRIWLDVISKDVWKS